MLLRDAGGPDRVEIAVAGYQFPDAPDLARRFSWHMVGGQARCRQGTWRFCWQALTCDESPLVSGWLSDVARAAAQAGSWPGPLHFLEPNLGFRVLPEEPAHARVVVSFDAEFRPPWHQQSRAGRSAGDPFILSFTMNGDQLQQAAGQWDAERAVFPCHA